MRAVRGIAGGLLAGLACCGGDAPTGTSSLPSSGLSVSGQVIATISGHPVPGARIEIGGATATSDATGAFQLGVAAAGPLPVQVSAPGHVTRRSFVRGGSGGARLDVIEESSLWHLGFYRELCRDGAGGGSLRALNPWTVEPSFYVDRRPERGRDRPIPDSAVETVVAAIGVTLPLLTRNRLRGDRIEVGTDPPPDQTPGTVVIRWDPIEVSQAAGGAAGIVRGVGGNASVVVLRTIEDSEAIFHELGHVLGLYHPLGGLRPSLMLGPGLPERPHFTPWDVHHANVLYARPPGNIDIDNDPSGFTLNLRAPSSVVMVCF